MSRRLNSGSEGGGLGDAPTARDPGDPPTALATILGEQGRRLGWVAQRLGVDASTVSRWCSGERPISESRREQLAAVLEVDSADLVDPAVDLLADADLGARR